jgi:adenylosuccinate synthase
MAFHDSHHARSVTVVAGLQFGDEGKGQITDRLAADHDVIVRVNGGANAGHSVRVGSEKHALHLLPCGIVRPETLNIIANGVALEPGVLLQEIDGLTGRGIDVGDNLRISDRAHLVLPWHRVEDRLRDALAARRLGDDQAIGTTGRGIGPCYADKMHRDTAFRVCDLLDPERVAGRLGHAVEMKNAAIGALARLADTEFEPFEAERLLSDFQAWGARLGRFVTDTVNLLQDALQSGRGILVEMAHAAELDVDHGTYPFVTSSTCSAAGVSTGCGLPASAVGRVVGVVKAYTSRVGNGPMSTELSGEEADRIRIRGKEFGTTTGRPRRIGWLDLPAVTRAARIGGVTEIALTGLSVLAGEEAVTVLTERGPEIWPGWDSVPDADGGLPATARAFVDRISEEVAPVSLVATGRRRDQILTGPIVYP